MTTISEIVEAFEYLYENLLDKEYAKSTGYAHYNESELLPLVRAYLLGYFHGDMQAEQWSSLPGCKTAYGRIDFLIGKVAVELAVRRKGGPKSCLRPHHNRTEVRKLLRWKGRAILILFDFDDNHFDVADIKDYRHISLGKGNWKTSGFNIAYFYRSGRPRSHVTIRRRVAVRK